MAKFLKGTVAVLLTLTAAVIIAQWEDIRVFLILFSYLVGSLFLLIATFWTVFLIYYSIALMNRAKIKNQVDFENLRTLRIKNDEANLRNSLTEQAVMVSLNQMREGRFYLKDVGPDKWLFDKLPGQVKSNPSNLLEDPSTSTRHELIPALTDSTCLLLVAGKGRGKTTTLHRLQESRSSWEQALVFDTHSNPSKWPHATKVVGSDINISEDERYNRMWSTMMGIILLKERRMDEYRKGIVPEAQFKPAITVYIDELTHIPHGLRSRGMDMKDFTGPLLTEGRKVNINFVFATHSDRVDHLGLKGSKDLQECFDAIIRLKSRGPERYATITWSDGTNDERVFLPPPPYSDTTVINSPDMTEFDEIREMEVIDGELFESEVPEVIEVEVEYPELPEDFNGKIEDRIRESVLLCVENGIELDDIIPARLFNKLGLSTAGRNYQFFTKAANDVRSGVLARTLEEE